MNNSGLMKNGMIFVESKDMERLFVRPSRGRQEHGCPFSALFRAAAPGHRVFLQEQGPLTFFCLPVNGLCLWFDEA